MIPPPDAKEITLACLAHISRAPRGNIGRSGREPAIDWSRLIAFASAHFVLQALPPALEDLGLLSDAPAEAREFLSAVADANAARNAMLRDAVIGIASHLNADGIIPVALKGAAFLLDDASATPAPWRFMGDLDLLVADAELEASVLALRDLGFMPAGNDYDPSSDAHYPPLISPCGTYSVELHTRLFGIDVFGLPVADVRRAAQRVANSAAAILIPTLAHRIVHVLSHAQLHNRNFAIRRLVLKDVLDLSQLVSREADGVVSSEEIFAHFDVLEDRRAAEALVAAWHRCTGVTTRLSVDPIAETWASRAILRLDRPRLRELVELPADILRLEAHRARRERGHWRRRLSLLTDPAKLVQASSNWTGKQRQRLWG